MASSELAVPKEYIIQEKLFRFVKTVFVTGQTRYVLRAKGLPLLGFLRGTEFLFGDVGGKRKLRLKQVRRLLTWYFTISENHRVIGEAGLRGRFSLKSIARVNGLCEFEVSSALAERTQWDITTDGGERIEVSAGASGWRVKLPPRLDDPAVLACLAITFLAVSGGY